jgi:pyruvate dehydrogenase E1 component alpha subunit
MCEWRHTRRHGTSTPPDRPVTPAAAADGEEEHVSVSDVTTEVVDPYPGRRRPTSRDSPTWSSC